MSKKAVVLLPTLNEVENIPLIIPAIFSEAPRLNSVELFICVIDDYSKDGTPEKVKDLQKEYKNLKLIMNPDKGLGEAYKKGIQYALSDLGSDYIFEMDADLQHDPKLIPLFVDLMSYDFDLVIGSRFAPGGSTPDFSAYRIFLSRFGNWLIRFLGGIPRIKDCTSGYRCIRASFLSSSMPSFLSTRGYSFQSSLLCELVKKGARVVEVPIIFKDRENGVSKLSFKDQWEFLLNIPKIRFYNSKDFIKFGIVGLSGVFVNLIVLFFMHDFFKFHEKISMITAIEISILSNFFLNNFWTFKKRVLKSSSFFRKFLSFHMVAALAGALNYVVAYFLLKKLGMNIYLAQMVGIATATLVNYVLNSNFTWKNSQKSTTQ